MQGSYRKFSAKMGGPAVRMLAQVGVLGTGIGFLLSAVVMAEKGFAVEQLIIGPSLGIFASAIAVGVFTLAVLTAERRPEPAPKKPAVSNPEWWNSGEDLLSQL